MDLMNAGNAHVGSSKRGQGRKIRGKVFRIARKKPGAKTAGGDFRAGLAPPEMIIDGTASVHTESYCPAWYCQKVREGGLAVELALTVLDSMSVETVVEGNHGGAKLVRAWNRRSK